MCDRKKFGRPETMMLCRVLNCRMFGMLNFENTLKSKSFMLGAVNSKVILTLIYFTRVIRTLFTKQFHRFYDEFPHSWGHLQLLFSSWHTVVRLWDPHQKISVHTVEWSTGCGAALFGVALRKEWRHLCTVDQRCMAPGLALKKYHVQT